MKIRAIQAIEISGACNLEGTCKWCPMSNRPRSRKRGLMSEETLQRVFEVLPSLQVTLPLALHLFGEPLLHPKFDEIAGRFAEYVPITVSTNGVLLDEAWADRLAKIPWSWISVSPWDEAAKERATKLLLARGIVVSEPPGVTHTWAGQVRGPKVNIFSSCPNLSEQVAVIRWDGTLASCCITDRDEDKLGSIFDEPLPLMRGYSLCETCHHATGG